MNLDAEAIITAGPIRLTCITYRVLQECFEDILANRNVQEKKILGREAIKALLIGLDCSNPIGKELWDIYIYLNGVLVSGTKTDLQKSILIIQSLLDGFSVLEHEEVEKAKNYTPPTYSTYGINESWEYQSITSFKA